MRKVTRDNEALSSKRVGSQRCLSMKLVEHLNLAASKRPYSVAHRVWRYCKDDSPCELQVDSSEQYGTDAPIVDASCHGSEESKNGNTTELRMKQSHRPSWSGMHPEPNNASRRRRRTGLPSAPRCWIHHEPGSGSNCS